MNMDDIPKIELPGSEGYWDAYGQGRQWVEQFPNQDADEFAYAIHYAAPLPEEIVGKTIDRLVMLQQGCNDGENWVWAVHPAHESYDYWNSQWWLLVAGCDYTGWDCQSGGTWTKVVR